MAARRVKPTKSAKRKAPVKRCDAGHRQGVDWKPAQGCTTCRIKERKLAAAMQWLTPDEWAALSGPAPSFLTIRVTRPPKVLIFAIPPDQLRAERERHRRKRGRRVYRVA